MQGSGPQGLAFQEPDTCQHFFFVCFLTTYTLHGLNVHEFEQTPGGGEGQGSLAIVRGVQRVKYDSATKQQQQCYYLDNLSCL